MDFYATYGLTKGGELVAYRCYQNVNKRAMYIDMPAWAFEVQGKKVRDYWLLRCGDVDVILNKSDVAENLEFTTNFKGHGCTRGEKSKLLEHRLIYCARCSFDVKTEVYPADHIERKLDYAKGLLTLGRNMQGLHDCIGRRNIKSKIYLFDPFSLKCSTEIGFALNEEEAENDYFLNAFRGELMSRVCMEFGLKGANINYDVVDRAFIIEFGMDNIRI